MSFSKESIGYYLVRGVGFLISRLPLSAALWLGKAMGTVGYYLDVKHKSIAYSNLKIAFARTKKPSEIKRIVKTLFQNYGRNLIELFRLPLIYREGYEKFVRVEGKEHVAEALKKNKGVILLAMHFGSWEISSLMGTMLNCTYKVITKPQSRYSRLDELLNSYRQQDGSQVLLRGRGTREVIESLRRNEVVGMVVDQGGKDGELVRFFGRLASMSVGAIRMALKYETPICFSIIIREKGSQHRLIIRPPLDLVKTGDLDKDVIANLNKITKIMEEYITQYPSEYMWFYKIWKYSKESTTIILSDGKAGHLRQSQAIAQMIDTALKERGIESETQIVDVVFKNKWAKIFIALLSFFSPVRFSQGRLRYLKWFLDRKSFLDIVHVKADFVVSCGSSVSGVNFLLSRDYRAKSICILKPGILGFKRFNLVILPTHDKANYLADKALFIQGAPNLISPRYLKEQADLLAKRFSQLKVQRRVRIGLLLGGDNKRSTLEESQVRIILGQIKSACEQLDADVLITSSRRTSADVEQLLQREMKGYDRCSLLILANRSNVPEAVGGILGLSDIVIVSGESISMVSEAASSGKNVIVFSLQKRKDFIVLVDKHDKFIQGLSNTGHILLSTEKDIGHFICDMAKNKIRTKPIDNNAVLFEAVKNVI